MSGRLRPALHTLWQALAASLLVWWHGAGLVGIHAVHNVSDAKRFALSVLVAVVAAAASAILHTAKQLGPGLAHGYIARHGVDDVELSAIDDVLDAAAAHIPETLDLAELLPHHAAGLAGKPTPGSGP